MQVTVPFGSLHLFCCLVVSEGFELKCVCIYIYIYFLLALIEAFFLSAGQLLVPYGKGLKCKTSRT